MAKKYYQTFNVKSTYSFPIDMLRYDKCYPETHQDTAMICGSFGLLPASEMAVTVAQQHLSMRPNWTPLQWASFGWTLGELS